MPLTHNTAFSHPRRTLESQSRSMSTARTRPRLGPGPSTWHRHRQSRRRGDRTIEALDWTYGDTRGLSAGHDAQAPRGPLLHHDRELPMAAPEGGARLRPPLAVSSPLLVRHRQADVQFAEL